MQEQNVTVYSDEASMPLGSNGESRLQVVTPQAVEEPEVGLVPQVQAQPVASLFSECRIFVNTPQYNWHVQGVVGANEEAKQLIIALAQRLYKFGHRAEECEMELWHQLGGAIELPKMEQKWANYQKVLEDEFNQFTGKVSNFINQEISQFRQRLTLLEGET